MKQFKTIFLIALVLGLTACSQRDSVSRKGPIDTKFLRPVPDTNYNIQDVRISVPDTLSVSEANVYFPIADIVWRGDDYGDRHDQVEAIFEESMTRALSGLHGSRPIYVDIEVIRFHSLTERTRYTVGGVHSIRFMLTLRDVQTGIVIGQPRKINADLKAFGGKKAVAYEHRGVTQKVRILTHLAGLIQQEVIVTETDEAVALLPAIVPEQILGLSPGLIIE